MVAQWFAKLFKREPKPWENGETVVARVNAKVMPIDRGEYFEDPLTVVLKREGVGEVTGGGTVLREESNEVEFCDLEILVTTPSEAVLELISTTLKGLGAPKGSRLILESGSESPFGKGEDIGIYLNGTDLPAEVYKSSDVNYVIREFKKLLGTWEGPTETALFLYGPSFAVMRSRLESFTTTYPLCQKCRIVQLA